MDKETNATPSPKSSVTLDPNNVRTHPDRNKKAIRKSLEKFGAGRSVVVDKDNVVRAGNGTVEQAEALGLTVKVVDAKPDELIAVRRKDWTEEEATAYAIADNQTATSADWDEEQLYNQLKELEEFEPGMIEALDFDLTDVEFHLRRLNGEEIQEVEAPDPTDELLAKWKVERGQVWEVGRHRLMCGDSTNATDVTHLMSKKWAHMVFTDPPYGVDIQERDLSQAEVRGRRKDGKGVLNDDLVGDDLKSLLEAVFTNTISLTKPGACWYVCTPPGVDQRHPLNVLSSLGVARHGIAWVKDRFVKGRCDYHYRHENIIYGWTPGGPHHPVHTRDQDSVWEFARPARSPEHPTMKPVELVAKAIGNSTKSSQLILDPFLGSGTTMVAAEQLGRTCLGLEIDPRYVAVCLERMTALGIECTLETT